MSLRELEILGGMVGLHRKLGLPVSHERPRRWTLLAGVKISAINTIMSVIVVGIKPANITIGGFHLFQPAIDAIIDVPLGIAYEVVQERAYS